MREDVKKNFVDRLKLAAQEVIDNAEDIVGNHDMMVSVDVTITIGTRKDYFEPEIRVSKSFYSDHIRKDLDEDWK